MGKQAKVGHRDEYAVFYPIETRWLDNDVYGHVNNVAYYAFFDSAVNRYLIEAGGLDIHKSSVVAYVVNSGCDYHAPLSYPQDLEAGIRVDHLGNRSVRYGIGIFPRGGTRAAADGHFVHVFVARDNDKATPIPDRLRSALAAIRMESGEESE